MSEGSLTRLRPELAEVVHDFEETPAEFRLELLLEYADRLPPMPERLKPVAEPVPECQTPLALAVEFEEGRCRLYFDAPPEAPTTRAFAGIVARGLDGATPEEVLATPDDFYVPLGLATLVSPLRLRGMSALLGRLKNRVRALTA